MVSEMLDLASFYCAEFSEQSCKQENTIQGTPSLNRAVREILGKILKESWDKVFNVLFPSTNGMSWEQIQHIVITKQFSKSSESKAKPMLDFIRAYIALGQTQDDTQFWRENVTDSLLDILEDNYVFFPDKLFTLYNSFIDNLRFIE